MNIHSNKQAIKHTNNTMNTHKDIENIIKKERVVTSSEIASNLKISWNTAEKYLLELVIDGKIEKIKKMGVNLWVIK
jgi:Mn-dependent DtxR family transcriptional regulator